MALPSYSYLQNALQNTDSINTRKNIISGPKMHQFWNHSPGLQQADLREEASFPVSGNIGALLKQEAINNYASCSMKNPIGGSPNCTEAFQDDIYSSNDTCGSGCKINNSSHLGIKDFGTVNGEATNIHGLHAYKNIRAASAGQITTPTYGCYEDVPNLKVDKNGMCVYDYKFSAETVGNWTKLKEFDGTMGRK